MKMMHRSLIFCFGLLVALTGISTSLSASEYKKAKGPYKVATLLEEWRDFERDRSLPVKIYYAPKGPPLRPVILFSHGLGGSRDAAPYLGEHLASYGYICVYMQHPGSDENIWKSRQTTTIEQAVANAKRNPRFMRDRFNDPQFIIDELARINVSHPKLKGRLNMQAIGMAGHSFGARTTFAAIGQRFAGGKERSVEDRRIKAAIVYSPAPPNNGTARNAFAKIKVPVFHFTGTEDASPPALKSFENIEPKDRTIPFGAIHKGSQYLLILDKADHGVFGGRRRAGPHAGDIRHLALIRMASIAFWDAYLQDNKTARGWLLSPSGLRAELEPGDVYKSK